MSPRNVERLGTEVCGVQCIPEPAPRPAIDPMATLAHYMAAARSAVDAADRVDPPHSEIARAFGQCDAARSTIADMRARGFMVATHELELDALEARVTALVRRITAPRAAPPQPQRSFAAPVAAAAALASLVALFA